MEAESPFEWIVRACGLPEILGQGIIRRALADAGLDPDVAEVEDWNEVLPHLEKRLKAYMPETEVAEKIHHIAEELEQRQGAGATVGEAPASRPEGGLSMSTPNPDRG